MVCLKKQSKRMTTKRRVKIERKVREHNRKKRKEAKKNPKKGKRKDPGVPSSLPFKEEFLKELKAEKEKVEEQRQKKREKLKQKRQKERSNLFNKNRNIDQVVADAAKRVDEYEIKQASMTSGDGSTNFGSSKPVETSRQAYVKEFLKVVQKAHVLLEVLDARDPMGSRSEELESLAKEKDKKLVIILNKIDLIPRENAEAWVEYLCQDFPTVAFKASTQNQNDNLSHRKMNLSSLSETLSQSSHCLGADVLMNLLSQCRQHGEEICVGVVGFPNTGKSSIINSLKRSKACTVGAMPGMTKTMQEVILSKGIKLLDCPGVVMDSDQSPITAVLRNVVRLEKMQDLVSPVEFILTKCNKEQLMLHYKLSDYNNVEEFLSFVAKRYGLLKKGGIPDADRAARTVLQDWISGRITYYTLPPKRSSAIEVSTTSEFKDIFDINKATISALPPTTGRSLMVVDSLGPAGVILDEDMAAEDEEIDDGMVAEDVEEDKSEGKMEVKSRPVEYKLAKIKTKKGAAETKEASVTFISARKAQKLALKKMKKNRRRADALSDTLSAAMDSAFNNIEFDEDDDE